MSNLELEVRSQLSDYLAGAISLEEFENWFTPWAWNIETSDPSVARLVHTIALRLAEFTSGDWTREELMEQLRPLVTGYEVLPFETRTMASTTATLTRSSFVVGRRLSGEPV